MGLADSLSKAGLSNAENQGATKFLSSGFPPLDHALSGTYKDGGFAQGRMHEIFGPPSAGKTAIATNVMVDAQRQGGFASFMDHERSFAIRLAKLLGLNVDPDYWVYQRPNTFESSIDTITELTLMARGLAIKDGEYVKHGDILFPMDKPIVIVFDSLAAMVPMSAWEKDAAKRNMNDNTALARATAAHFPKLNNLSEECNVTLLILNQIRTKIGVMYGDPTTTPGGGAPEFYCSTRTKLGRSILTEGEGAKKVKVGQRIGCEVIKNKISRPFEKVEWDFLWQADGSGKFDVIGGCIEELVKLGKIERAGAWTTWDGKKFNSRRLLEEHIVAAGQLPKLLSLFPA